MRWQLLRRWLEFRKRNSIVPREYISMGKRICTLPHLWCNNLVFTFLLYVKTVTSQRGVEPPHSPPEGDALSTELLGHIIAST